MVNNPFKKIKSIIEVDGEDLRSRSSGAIIISDTPSLWDTDTCVSDSLDRVASRSYVDDKIREAFDRGTFDRGTGAFIRSTFPSERMYCFPDPEDPTVSISITEKEIYERVCRDRKIEEMFKKWYPSLSYIEENVSMLPKNIIADSVGTAIAVLLVKWWNASLPSDPNLVMLDSAATLYRQFKIVSMITLFQKLNKTLPEKETNIILKKFEEYLQTGSLNEEDKDKKKKRKKW